MTIQARGYAQGKPGLPEKRKVPRFERPQVLRVLQVPGRQLPGEIPAGFYGFVEDTLTCATLIT